MHGQSNICLRRADHGAAAVEFALVVPILVMLLLGIIDYGLYFANSLSVRSGASDAARQISVGNLSGDCNDPPAVNGSGEALINKVKTCVSPVGAGVYAKVTYDEGWAVGNNVRVCALVDVDGTTGFTPMPKKGRVAARVVMPIQQDSTPPSSLPPLPPLVDGENLFQGWC